MMMMRQSRTTTTTTAAATSSTPATTTKSARAPPFSSLLSSSSSSSSSLFKQQQKQRLPPPPAEAAVVVVAVRSNRPYPCCCWGAASIKGGRLVNEDWAQGFPAGEGKRGAAAPAAAVYCVHDGHGGSSAVVRLAQFMGGVDWPIHGRHQRSPAMSEVEQQQQRTAHMRFMGGMYTLAGHELKDEASGAVSVAALCLPDAVCLAWVGDCEGCVFGPSGIRTAEGMVENDLAEQTLLGPSKDHSLMPSFYRVGGDRLVHGAAGALPIATSAHTLMGSSPLVAMDQEEERMRRRDAEGGGQKVGGRERCVHLTARGMNFQSVAAQREYDLARIQSANPLLEIDLTLLRLGESTLLGDVRFAGSVQPTRVLGDKGVTPAMGTLRLPTVLWAPLRRPSGAAAAAAATNGDDRLLLLLCSDGAFSGAAFGGMAELVDCLNDPLRFVRRRFFRRGQELTERLLLAGRLCLEEEDEPPADAAAGTTRACWTTLTRAWRAVRTWRQFLAFLDVHLAEIRHPHTLRTLQPQVGLPQQRSGGAGAQEEEEEAGVEDDFYARWLSAATISARWLKQHTGGGSSSGAEVEEKKGALFPPFSLADGSSSSSSSSTLPSLAEMVAHLAVLMGSSDNVTVLLARL